MFTKYTTSAYRQLVFIMLAAVCVAFILPTESMAKEKKRGTKAKASSEKLDISDLEQKYWAPKDTDFGVVQNRTYSKEKKFAASVQYGQLLNDAFNDGNMMALTGNYYFNERMGLEFTYQDSNYKDSRAVDVFKTQLTSGTAPDMGRVDSYVGLGYNWVPFYAKMSFMGKKIIYFDMVVTPGVGMTEYTQLTTGGVANKGKSAFTYSMDVTQYFFLSKNWAVRADLRNRWFKEEIIQYKAPYSTLRKKNTYNQVFLIGAQYLF